MYQARVSARDRSTVVRVVAMRGRMRELLTLEMARRDLARVTVATIGRRSPGLEQAATLLGLSCGLPLAGLETAASLFRTALPGGERLAQEPFL